MMPVESIKKRHKVKESPVEDELKYFTKNFLLHGSRVDIRGNIIQPKEGGVFATDSAAIAIMKAIYSNFGSRLKYPYFIDEKIRWN